MPLELKPLEADDFEIASKYEFNHGGDLIAPALPFFWPSTDDDEEMARRNAWSLGHQKNMFFKDPTAHFLKVVDTENKEIIALARWHFYKEGYKHPEMTALELEDIEGAKGEQVPKQINAELGKDLLLPLFEMRSSWSGSKPQWVLTTLITKEPQRKRGAGSLLVNWGIEQAKKHNVPAYLEATAAGSPLYAKLGFKKVGEFSYDFSKYGLPSHIPFDRMAFNVD